MFPRGSIALGLLTAAVWLGSVAVSHAQQQAPPAKARQRVEAQEPREPAEPKKLALITGDGVQLSVTYYAGLDDKESTPVVLVHGYKGKGADYGELPKLMQATGFAVVVPDLRGHGESTHMRSGGTIDAGSLQKGDFIDMVRFDMETVKGFLTRQNNEGHLNIDKLCVVGADMGATVAINWAALDWSWPVLATGKQGQDVKALVLLSPEWTFRGVRINDALANDFIKRSLALLILVGKGSSSAVQQSTRVYQAFERFHPASGDKKDLFYFKMPTSLQSTKMFGENLKTEDYVVKFVQHRVASIPIPWQMRKNPLE